MTKRFSRKKLLFHYVSAFQVLGREVDLQPTELPNSGSDMWLNMVNVKLPNLSNLETDSMKKFIVDYERYSPIFHDNCYAKCSDLFWRSNSRSSVKKTVEITRTLWNYTERRSLKLFCAYIRQIRVKNGELW